MGLESLRFILASKSSLRFAACAAIAGAGSLAQADWSWSPWAAKPARAASGPIFVWGRGYGRTPRILEGIDNAQSVTISDGIGAAITSSCEVYAFSPETRPQQIPFKSQPVSVAVRSKPTSEVVIVDSSGYVHSAKRDEDSSFSPAQIISGALRSATVKKVSCGKSHCVAIASDGKAFAWGANNSHGQLGNGLVGDCPGGASPEIPARIEVPGNARIVSAACGDAHTILLDDNGVVYGVGNEKWAQLGKTAEPWKEGHGDPSGVVERSHLISKLNVTAVACGGEHTAVLVKDGTVFSFGYNQWGQLGHHNYSTFAPPNPVADIEVRAVDIAAGQNHTCVIRDDGEMHCIGGNDCGQLGVGTLQPSIVWRRMKHISSTREKQPLRPVGISLGGDASAAIVHTNT